MGRRQLLRVEAKIVVEFKTTDQFYREYTRNISRGGIYIKTKNPLPVQTVLEITIRVPGLAEGIMVMGEVVHIIEAGSAENNNWDPGMGIHFIDYEETAKDQIESYVHHVIEEKPESAIPDRRKDQRLIMRLRVRFPSREILQHDFAEDISQGGIFITTEKPREVGDRFLLTLVHPDTAQELILKGEVVRIVLRDAKVPGSVNGMGLKFIDVDQQNKDNIKEFLRTDLPVK